jgi:hypothetical protein
LTVDFSKLEKFGGHAINQFTNVKKALFEHLKEGCGKLLLQQQELKKSPFIKEIAEALFLRKASERFNLPLHALYMQPKEGSEGADPFIKWAHVNAILAGVSCMEYSFPCCPFAIHETFFQ